MQAFLHGPRVVPRIAYSCGILGSSLETCVGICDYAVLLDNDREVAVFVRSSRAVLELLQGDCFVCQ